MRQRDEKENLSIECPACGGTTTTNNNEHKFLYGKGADAVELSTVVPVIVCNSCGFSHTDWRAEVARDLAIRKYLGVKSPEEVAQIRNKHDLSRSDFADLTGLGTASLTRWETGVLIQNEANDRYLFLLEFSDNIRRLMTYRNSSPLSQEIQQKLQKEDATRLRERGFTHVREPERCRIAAITWPLRRRKA